MTEYIMGVIAVSILSALASFFSYGGASERAVKAAIAMITIYTVCVPALKLVSEITPEDFSFDVSMDSEISEGEYVSVAKDAFCDGVAKFISEKFHLIKEEVRVSVSGFDFESMRAEKITVILNGRSALSDTNRIAQAVTEAGLGECEVDIRIG